MLEIYAFFFFFYISLHPFSKASIPWLQVLLCFFLPLLSLEVKLEKKKKRRRTRKSCVSKFVIYSELSRIKRLAWVKVFIKSKISSNEKRVIHQPILFSYAAGDRKKKLASQLMPFLNLCIIQGVWQPFPFSTSLDPMGVSLLPWYLSTTLQYLILLT